MKRYAIALFAFAGVLSAQQNTAKIKIDTDRVIGEVNPRIFGNFTEHLGRCIYGGLGTVEDARNWVEYTNEAGDTYWARERRKNGRDKPYGVKIWGLGNEIDGPWQLGHKNAEDYCKFALEAAKAMRCADESITLIASGSSNFNANADWVAWNRTVLENLKSEIDYISLHTYIGNRDNNFEKFLAVSRDLDDRIEVVKGLIRAATVNNPRSRPIAIAFDEWNVWYRARGS